MLNRFCEFSTQLAIVFKSQHSATNALSQLADLARAAPLRAEHVQYCKTFWPAAVHIVYRERDIVYPVQSVSVKVVQLCVTDFRIELLFFGRQKKNSLNSRPHLPIQHRLSVFSKLVLIEKFSPLRLQPLLVNDCYRRR